MFTCYVFVSEEHTVCHDEQSSHFACSHTIHCDCPVHFKCITAPIAQEVLLLSRMHPPKPCATHALPDHPSRDKLTTIALDKRPVFIFYAGKVTFVAEELSRLVGEVGHGNFLADTSITHLFDPKVP